MRTSLLLLTLLLLPFNFLKAQAPQTPATA